MTKIVLVVTSINKPNGVMKSLAEGCLSNGWHFVLVGDKKSPNDFHCDGIDYYSLAAQHKTGFDFALKAPIGHYSRKNIGYLVAIKENAEVIVETDDDNYPLPGFWKERTRLQPAAAMDSHGWLNVYKLFGDTLIWPRGLPLNEVHAKILNYSDLSKVDCDTPIQQGLADENPDVDAIYRFILPLPHKFLADRRVALRPGTWCPFNSQNTTWFKVAFPLLYLPSSCSFRMTDIWRSFVAQRISWENDWSVQFHSPTVWQDRNAHDLMSDFSEEVPGYLHNARIAHEFDNLNLRTGIQNIGDNMLLCYESLVKMQLIDVTEIDLLKAWLEDLKSVGHFT
jgi:hypothetical protein